MRISKNQNPAALYAQFCQRFSEEDLATGTWEARDDRDLARFRDAGLALYPIDQRPRSLAALSQHPLFNLAYIAMRGDDIVTTSWPLIVEWFRAGEPLNEREQLALASMAVQRLETDYVWYQEAEAHQIDARRATAQQVFDVARDLGWEPQATLRAYPKDWQAFRQAWNGFIADHPVGPLFRGWEEERILRKALVNRPVDVVVRPRPRL